MICCLFEDDGVAHLKPLASTHAAYDLRVGMHTILERAGAAFSEARFILHARPEVAAVTAEAHDLLTNRIPGEVDVLFLNGRYVLEEGEVLDRLRAAAQPGEPARRFVQDGALVAAWAPGADPSFIEHEVITNALFETFPEEELEGAELIRRMPDLLTGLRARLRSDFKHFSRGYNIFERPGADIHESVLLENAEQIIVAPGATVRPGAILNAADGPIFIGENATVWESAVVRGPVFVGAGAQVRVHANIEGCAVGPGSKVGGEIHTSIIHSHTNKVHAGFLGHSYLGQWCNIGADANNSNLKNNYGEISLYNEALGEFENTGRQFVGLFMGDHSKCGINTMFNTGTVVGVSCNLFGAGFPPRYVPSFSWGSPAEGYTSYRLEKALEVAEAMMARRGIEISEAQRALLTAIAREREEAEPAHPA